MQFLLQIGTTDMMMVGQASLLAWVVLYPPSVLTYDESKLVSSLGFPLRTGAADVMI